MYLMKGREFDLDVLHTCGNHALRRVILRTCIQTRRYLRSSLYRSRWLSAISLVHCSSSGRSSTCCWPSTCTFFVHDMRLMMVVHSPHTCPRAPYNTCIQFTSIQRYTDTHARMQTRMHRISIVHVRVSQFWRESAPGRPLTVYVCAHGIANA